MHIRKLAGTALVVLAGSLAGIAQANFNINITYTGVWNTAERTAFSQAETFWESVITGYQPRFVQDLATIRQTISGIDITADRSLIDGLGGILGSAGPTSGWIRPSYTVATTGSMKFDSADTTSMVANGTFASVVMHEMGHVLGIGTLWTDNGVYVQGSGQYTGANGLAAYRTEFSQPNASFVPVELGGSAGTANGHWNEVDGGVGLTHITDAQGRDMRDELMTGWIAPGRPTFVSRTTIASLTDIGYTVNLSAVPEPGTWMLFAAGVPLLLRRRRLPRGG